MPNYILGLGSNSAGRFGLPEQSIRQSVVMMQLQGWHVKRVSGLYNTAPVSPLPQPRYVNAAVVVDAPIPPAVMLRVLKAMERAAGRTRVRSRGARPLDVDIIAAGGRTVGRHWWRLRDHGRDGEPIGCDGGPGRRGLLGRCRRTTGGRSASPVPARPSRGRPPPRRQTRPHLIVPHPQAHVRTFVLDPVLEIAPHWWHAGLGVPGRRLWHRLRRSPGDVVKIAGKATAVDS